MMILRYSAASPYARKIRIAADWLGVSGQIRLESANTADPADSLRRQNPLGKIPTLILPDGVALYDSRVIAEFVDCLAGGGRLIPADPGRRIMTLRLQALGDGICDAALLIRHETATRRPEWRDPDAIALQQGKIDRALATLEAEPPPAGAPDIGQIALACALGYLDLRFEGAWRQGHPRLAAWLADFAARVPAYAASAS